MFIVAPLIRTHLIKNRDLLINEAKHINGFMKLLMKHHNTGVKWTDAEKHELKQSLRHLATYVPALFCFLLPCGLLLLPVLAEIMDRRKISRDVSGA
ncbi:MAG: hypothetical protein NTX75_13655 [Proteobacteria bacterium]|nr:hypothetical protein [Pseudomonadota bacterium]